MTFRFRVTSYTSSVTGVLGKSDNTSIPGPYIYILYTCMSTCILSSGYFGGCTIDTCYTCSHHTVSVATINSMKQGRYKTKW